MSLMIKNARVILSDLPGEAAWLARPDIRIRDDKIAAISSLTPLPEERQIDVRDCVIYPTWVSTHHHPFRSLLKGEPQGLNQNLTVQLSATPYRFRAAFDKHTFRLAIRVGLVELLHSGCTSATNHNYLYWPDMPFDTSEIVFNEGEALEMRIVLCQDGATQDRAVKRDLPVALRPETFDGYMADIERLVSRYHDSRPGSLHRVVITPTTVLHPAPDAQPREVAKLVRQPGIRLHSHLSETVSYLDTAQQEFAMTPAQFCTEHDWLENGVWFTHLVKLLPEEIALLDRAGTSIAHYPQNDGRLGSGIANLLALEQAGVPVSLGVDSAAPNETTDIQSGAHATWLLQRTRKGMLAQPRCAGDIFEGGADATTVEDVVHWGSAGGAQILGLAQTGTSQVDIRANLTIYRLDDPRCFGLHDMTIGPMAYGGRAALRALLLNDRLTVKDDAIPGLDLDTMRHNALAAVRTLQQHAAV